MSFTLTLPKMSSHDSVGNCGRDVASQLLVTRAEKSSWCKSIDPEVHLLEHYVYCRYAVLPTRLLCTTCLICGKPELYAGHKKGY